MFEPQDLPDLQLLLVERDRRVRRSLAGILEVNRCVGSVASVPDVDEAIALVSTDGSCDPDAILVDLEWEDGDGWVEAVARLRSACDCIVIVALTDDAALGARALRAGADLALGVSAVADDICCVRSLIPNRQP